MDARHNTGQAAETVFATNDKQEAIQVAKDYGQGTVVVSMDENGDLIRIFTAPYQTALGLAD